MKQWYNEKSGYSEEDRVYRIYVKVRQFVMILCPKCGWETKRNGYEPKERTWCHGMMLHCAICPTGRIFQEKRKRIGRTGFKSVCDRLVHRGI